MRIGMVGAGYVGLVSGACLAEFGIDVVCVDRDPEKIRQLRGGNVPIFEPGLEGLIESNVDAGPGYGGFCLPKDTRALGSTARHAGSPVRSVETVVEVNEIRVRRMIEKVETACGGSVSGKRVAILGLTFKPNTDDIRESAGLGILAGLLERGARLSAFDPKGMDSARSLFDGVEWCEDAYAAMEDAAFDYRSVGRRTIEGPA